MCAIGSPINMSIFSFEKAFIIALCPIPGSIITGIAPIRIIEKVRMNICGDGLTNKSTL